MKRNSFLKQKTSGRCGTGVFVYMNINKVERKISTIVNAISEKLSTVFRFASLSTAEMIARITLTRIKGTVRIFTDHTVSPSISMRVPNQKPIFIFSQRMGRKSKKLAIKHSELNAIAIIPAKLLFLSIRYDFLLFCDLIITQNQGKCNVCHHKKRDTIGVSSGYEKGIRILAARSRSVVAALTAVKGCHSLPLRSNPCLP